MFANNWDWEQNQKGNPLHIVCFQTSINNSITKRKPVHFLCYLPSTTTGNNRSFFSLCYSVCNPPLTLCIQVLPFTILNCFQTNHTNSLSLLFQFLKFFIQFCFPIYTKQPLTRITKSCALYIHVKGQLEGCYRHPTPNLSK